MTAQDIAIVRDSFRKVAPIADHVVALYFARLFELDPSVRRLCCGGMEQQERRIVRTMGALIGWLETLEKLKPALRRLGARQ
ncbi:MAG TPA: hypothetical protein VEQ65_11550, partial [Opitutus sp.]|nr:hypothetical protein [Opitutus sp.]